MILEAIKFDESICFPSLYQTDRVTLQYIIPLLYLPFDIFM